MFFRVVVFLYFMWVFCGDFDCFSFIYVFCVRKVRFLLVSVFLFFGSVGIVFNSLKVREIFLRVMVFFEGFGFFSLE